MYWPVPKSVQEIWSFLGMTGYYIRFVLDFAKIIPPLTKLTRKEVEMSGWGIMVRQLKN